MNVTIKLPKEKLAKFTDFYNEYKLENSNEYVIFFAKYNDIPITVFSSKKEDYYKVTFVGKNPIDEAKMWDENAKATEPKKTIKQNWLDLGEQIGSDEVGTGDLFGPVCVCAVYLKPSDVKLLKSLGVDDSKKLDDEKILEIAPKLIANLEYSQLSLDNKKYNEITKLGENMNSIKAKMHNKALFNLFKNHKKCPNVYVDQFCDPKKYYEYLKKSPVILEDITFHTKGESYYPSVAAASVIARYSFLKHLEELNKKYSINLPFGAGSKADEFLKKIQKNSSIDLNEIAKMNFKNFKD